eukprot:10170988-Ditylum_brightwellii.AAC.1
MLNDYLVDFSIPEGVTTTKFSSKEFVNVLEDGIPFQWKLEFEKKGFNSSSAMLKAFLDTCMCLEEAKMHNLTATKIA